MDVDDLVEIPSPGLGAGRMREVTAGHVIALVTAVVAVDRHCPGGVRAAAEEVAGSVLGGELPASVVRATIGAGPGRGQVLHSAAVITLDAVFACGRSRNQCAGVAAEGDGVAIAEPAEIAGGRLIGRQAKPVLGAWQVTALDETAAGKLPSVAHHGRLVVRCRRLAIDRARVVGQGKAGSRAGCWWRRCQRVAPVERAALGGYLPGAGSRQRGGRPGAAAAAGGGIRTGGQQHRRARHRRGEPNRAIRLQCLGNRGRPHRTVGDAGPGSAGWNRQPTDPAGPIGPVHAGERGTGHPKPNRPRRAGRPQPEGQRCPGGGQRIRGRQDVERDGRRPRLVVARRSRDLDAAAARRHPGGRSRFGTETATGGGRGRRRQHQRERACCHLLPLGDRHGRRRGSLGPHDVAGLGGHRGSEVRAVPEARADRCRCGGETDGRDDAGDHRSRAECGQGCLRHVRSLYG